MRRFLAYTRNIGAIILDNEFAGKGQEIGVTTKRSQSEQCKFLLMLTGESLQYTCIIFLENASSTPGCY